MEEKEVTCAGYGKNKQRLSTIIKSCLEEQLAKSRDEILTAKVPDHMKQLAKDLSEMHNTNI